MSAFITRNFYYCLLLLCTTLLSAGRLQAQNIRYRGNIKGGFTLTGNTFRYNQVFTDFLNTEAAAGVDRSSAADLVLPPGSKIIKALLYVEGMTLTPITEVRFKVPGGTFQSYNTASPEFLGNPGGSSGYQQFILDVTRRMPANGYVSTLSSGGNPSGAGRYAVADFSPALSTNFGYGWSLFVVYTNPASKYRSVSIADNNTYLSLGIPVDLTINDVVVPVTGLVRAVVGLTGSYGDYGASWGDNVSLGGSGGAASYLADPLTGSTSDILNSSIAFCAGNNVSADGGPAMSGNYMARSPYFFTCPNDPSVADWSSYYFDADIMDASGILPNSNIPIDVKLTQTLTSADAIGSGTYAISVDIAAAILTKAFNPQVILPGGTATCTFTIANNQAGAINLDNIGFTDNLPPGLIIASPAAAVINGSTTGAVTATSGSNIITVSGLSLAAGQSATVTVNITNVPGQLNPACAANPVAFTNGFGNINGVSANLVNNVSDQCLIVTPTLPPAVTSLTYCQYATALPLTATGVNLRWYTSASGGTGSTTPPTPSTAVPGTTTWYVSQTLNDVESPLAALSVSVIAPDTPLFDSMFVCLGAIPKPLPVVSINGISGSWNPAIVNTLATASYTFTPGTGQCAVPVTLPVVVRSAKEIPWILDAAMTLSRDTLCQGDTLSFSNSSSVQYPPVSCLWNFGNGSSTTDPNPVVRYPAPGAYTVALIVTDSQQCSDTAYHTLVVDSLPSLTISTDRQRLCTGESVTCTANYTLQGNTQLHWDFGDNNNAHGNNPALHAYDQAGNFTIKAIARYRACKDRAAQENITVAAFPDVYIGPDTSICPNSAPLLLSNRQQRDPGDHYLWSTGDTSTVLKVTGEGIYSLNVENADGCATRDETVIHRDCYLDIPNAFTPDGDGLNDFFFPRQLMASGVTAFSMTVFNRWGNTVFQSEKPDGRGWDGRFNSAAQPAGVYPYLINVTFNNGRSEHYQGNVTLLR